MQPQFSSGVLFLMSVLVLSTCFIPSLAAAASLVSSTPASMPIPMPRRHGAAGQAMDLQQLAEGVRFGRFEQHNDVAMCASAWGNAVDGVTTIVDESGSGREAGGVGLWGVLDSVAGRNGQVMDIAGAWESPECSGVSTESAGTVNNYDVFGDGLLRVAKGKKRRRGKAKLCTFTGGCGKMPYFGDEQSRMPLFCKQHKEAWHVNVLSKRCESDGCLKRPVFGHPSFRVIRFCKKHKMEGHIDLANKRCKYSGCTKHPVFGEPSDRTSASFCAEHCADHHVDIRHRKCAQDGCDTLPSFGDASPLVQGNVVRPRSSTPQFCWKHKLPGQVCLTHRTSLSSRCSRSPSLPPSSFSPTSVPGQLDLPDTFL